MKQFEICFLIISILLVSSVTAMEWDNVYDYDEKTEEVIIVNRLGFGSDLAKLKLISNTDKCGSYCNAVIEYTPYDDVTLPSKFTGTFGFEFEGIVNDYNLELGTWNYDEGMWYWDYQDWDYKNKVLKSGETYRVRLVGRKNKGSSVEWFPNFIGIKVTEWAWWTKVNENGFQDNFNRADSSDLGANWNEYATGGAAGHASIKSNTLYINHTDTGTYTVLASGAANVNDSHAEMELSFRTEGVGAGGWVKFQISNEDGQAANSMIQQILINRTDIIFYDVDDNSATFNSSNHKKIIDGQWNTTLIKFDYTNNKIEWFMNGSGMGNVSFHDAGASLGEIRFEGVAAAINFSIDYIQWGEELITYTELYFPIDNFNTTSTSVTFNCSGHDNYNVTNVSLYLDGVLNFTVENIGNVVGGYSNFTELYKTVDNINLGLHNWTCLARDNETNYGMANNRTFEVLDWLERGFSLNTTSYETKNEYFTLNLSYDTSLYTSAIGNLWYNGTSYLGTKVGTGMNISYTRSLDVPKVSAKRNHSVYWQMSFTNSTGTFKRNSTKYNQTADKIVLGLCNSTLQVPYVNFTFKDEASNVYMNASVDLSSWAYWIDAKELNETYSFTNLTNHSKYAFCFSPNDTSIEIELSLQYSLGGYPQRRFSAIDKVLSNTTWNKTLYLLGAGDGSYVTFLVQTTSGASILGVSVTVQREIDGTWTLVSEGDTGDDGIVTFWLNPDYDHRFTFSKSGYDTITKTIRPTQSLYTILLAGTEVNITHTSTIEGLRWSIRPIPGPLKPRTDYTFWFNITSSKDNLVSYSMNITNATGVQFASARGTSSSGSNLSFTMNTGNNKTLYGSLYVDIGDGIFLIDPAIWTTPNITMGNLSVYAFLINLKDSELMTDDEQQFTTLFFIFFIGILMLVGFTRFTGVELQSPGMILIFVLFIIMFLSGGGLFEFTYAPNSLPFINKWGIAMVCGTLIGGYFIGRVAEGR